MRTLIIVSLPLLFAACSDAWVDASPASRAIPADQLTQLLQQATDQKGTLPARADEADIVEGRWRVVRDDVFARPDEVSPSEVAATSPSAPHPMVPPAPPPIMVEPPPPPTLPVPRRRATPAPRRRGTPPRASRTELARAHYLDHPTTVQADKITFYCPVEYLSELRLKAADVHETSPDRRVATGGARLLCRELTLIAERITLRIRRTPNAELQITARGGVELVSRVRNKVVRETGLRSVILRQDGMLPLR